jgi:hypothetical protein
MFHQSDHNDSEADLFGSFMSALYTFSSQIFEKGLSGFDLENSRYLTKKQNDVLFIATCDSKLNQKQVYKEFQSIISIFFKTYSPDQISNWTGSSSVFENFSIQLERLFNR